MSAAISLVLVTHRSSAVAAAAAASFRAQVRELGLAGEVVIVDHSEDDSERALLGNAGPDRLLARPNRGYAAGVNAGVAAARGDTLLVGNPDIVFEPGALAALLEALAAGWDVVGPQFTLAGFLFPPADLQTPGEQLRRWLAGKSVALWRRELRRELGRWRAVWGARSPVPATTLSGALLAFRRSAFERSGVWDEGYFLFFEETEWMRRAAAAGLRLAQVPGARVRHSWGHAADPERSGQLFAASRARFLAGCYGWRGRLALRLRPAAAPLAIAPLSPAGETLPHGRVQWLLSPTALGLPAAMLTGTAEELSRALRGVAEARNGRGRYLVFAADPAGAGVLGAWSWEAHDG